MMIVLLPPPTESVSDESKDDVAGDTATVSDTAEDKIEIGQADETEAVTMAKKDRSDSKKDKSKDKSKDKTDNKKDKNDNKKDKEEVKYYSELDKLYKTTQNMTRRITLFTPLVVDGKVFFYDEYNLDFVIYDIAGKEVISKINSADTMYYYYFNDAIYAVSGKGCTKYDTDGNKLLNYSGGLYYGLKYDRIAILDDGSIFFQFINFSSKESMAILSPDFKTLTDLSSIPFPEYKAGHNIMKPETSLDFVPGNHPGKIYFRGEIDSSYQLYYLDANDPTEFIACDFSVDGRASYIADNYVLGVGQTGYFLYDIDTGKETTAQDDDYFFCLMTMDYMNKFGMDAIHDWAYAGGNSHIALENGKWVRKQLIKDTTSKNYSDREWKDLETLGSESGYMDMIYCVDDTYYIFQDSYGAFLRTYKNGEAEEDPIIVY